MSATARRRLNGSVLVLLFAALGFLWSLPAKAQGVAPVDASAFDMKALVVALVLPYIASGLSIASMVGVLKWVARPLRVVPGLRLIPHLLLKDPGAEKLRPEQVDATRGIVVGLATVAALRGSVVPLGGEAAGALGLVGAVCLLSLLAMASREGLQAALRSRKAP